MVKYRYYCDICGADMPDGYTPQTQPASSPQGAMKCTDLCQECAKVYSSLDIPTVLRDTVKALRKKIKAPQTTVTFVGNGSHEKRPIYERLTRYSNRVGLGALKKVADASDGKLTDTDVRMMAGGAKVNPKLWKVLDVTLNALEREEQNAG